LPYELYVDGARRELGDRAYLLSPEDLEASALVPELAAAGVVSLKIEGRLKGPEYVGAVTALYRRAVDALEDGALPSERLRARALQTFTRGSGPGFLQGIDHQRLVEARSSDHRGTLLGSTLGVQSRAGRQWVELELRSELARGDGILIEGGFSGVGELGGRVWSIEQALRDVPSAQAGGRVCVWLGPDVAFEAAIPAQRRVFLTHDPRLEAEIQRELSDSPARIVLDFEVNAAVGAPLGIRARSARGREATWQSDKPLQRAHGVPTTRAVVADKLGRLGETPYQLGRVDAALAPDVFIPVSELNHARRALVDSLRTLAPREERQASSAGRAVVAPALAERPPIEAGLFALCRNLEQARAALGAGASGVYLDFLELTGTGQAFRALRAEFPAARLGVVPPRIRKPGEEKIDRYLASLAPDYTLVRGLGALHELTSGTEPEGVTSDRSLRLGDFSLNVASRSSAELVLRQGLFAFTPAFDLDGAQLALLVRSEVGRFAEVVVHHPMPLFHMEHCVYAALLSNGTDHKSCGRPCDRHVLELRDRSGRIHPVVADVGCRNTVFHGASQSAAPLISDLQDAGVSRFRIELLRESPEEARAIVTAYRELLDGKVSGSDVWKRLRAESGYGVVRGSLRVVS
jgi:putative protease